MNKSDDTIRRQAAIDAVEKESQVDGAYGYMDTKSIVDLLNDLPSAQARIDKFENDPDYGCSFEENGDMDGIVAWMPLPEPWKGEEG